MRVIERRAVFVGEEGLRAARSQGGQRAVEEPFASGSRRAVEQAEPATRPRGAARTKRSAASLVRP